jgi:hypothetical protein
MAPLSADASKKWLVVVVTGEPSPPSQLNESAARTASPKADTEGELAGFLWAELQA